MSLPRSVREVLPQDAHETGEHDEVGLVAVITSASAVVEAGAVGEFAVVRRLRV